MILYRYRAAIAITVLLLPRFALAADRAVLAYQKGISSLERQDYGAAIDALTQAIALDPKNADACSNRAYAYTMKRDYDMAIADWTNAIRLDPKSATAHFGRGLVYEAKRELDKAIADYTEAMRLRPKWAAVSSDRGRAYEKNGKHERAIADFKQAMTIDPKYARAYQNLAWLQATCPDGKYRNGGKAVEIATKAYQLSNGKSWRYLDTLAAAYAQNGDFENATLWQAKTIEMALTDKSLTEEGKEELRFRMELYKKGRPYRGSEKAGDANSRGDTELKSAAKSASRRKPEKGSEGGVRGRTYVRHL